MTLNPEQFGHLFHGTAANIPTGDVIHPGKRDYFYNENARARGGIEYPEGTGDGIGAYATPDIKTAKRFAKQAMTTKYYAASDSGEDYQQELFAPVYPVEHMSHHSDPSGRLIEHGQTHARDKKGFKVTGQPVAYANYNDPD